MEFTPEQVEAAHTIADLTTDLGRHRRVAADTSDLLVDALAALRAGDYNVVGEFLDRSIFALRRLPMVEVR